MPSNPHMTLTARGHAKRLLVLGLPLIGGHVAQFAISLTDTVMLGRYDVDALAGQVLGSGLFFLLYLVGSGFAWAVMPLVAHAHEKNAEIRRITRMGFWLSLGFALMTLPVFLLATPLFILVRQPSELASLAGAYLAIQGWAIIPALLAMTLKSYLAALEFTRVIFWVTVAAAIVNIGLNDALIFGKYGAPELGIRGAAWASFIVNLFNLALMVALSLKTARRHLIYKRVWRIDRDALRRVFALGWPIGLTSMAEVGLFTMSSVMMGWLGAVPLAAHGIALQIASLTFMVHMGLSNAATVRSGNAMGRADKTGLILGAKVAYALSLIFACITMLAFFALPQFWVSLFLDQSDPDFDQVLRLGATLLLAAAVFQVVDGGQVLALGLLRGLQDTSVPMLIAALSYWGLGLTTSYLLGFVLGMGGLGVWYGLIAGLSLAALLLSWRLWSHTIARLPENGSSG